MSIGNVTFAQTWAEYNTPASATAVAVSDNAIFVFSSDQYYLVSLPLPHAGEALSWAQMIVPGSGNIKAGVVTPDGIVFVLRGNGDLWRLSNGQWENIFPDQVIEGLSGISGDRFFAWSGDYIYEYLGGFTQMAFDNAKSIAFNEDYVMVFTDNFETYSGPNSWTLSPAENLINFYPSEATMTHDEYIVAGTVIGSLAAWHQSPPNACVPFTHVLTEGVINSVATSEDTAWVVGRLGEKGMLFNTTDMSGIYFVPETVWQIRSNANGVVAAVSNSKLYVHGNVVVSSSSEVPVKEENKVVIAPNPIKSSQLRFMSDLDTDAAVFNQLGSTVAKLKVTAGINTCTLNLPAGIYFLRTESGITKKFIVY